MESVEECGTAIERGYKLSKGEQIVRSVINSIMCNGLLRLDETADEFGLTLLELKELLLFDPARFEDFIADGLMQLDNNEIRLTEKGFLCARNIAMALDPALKTGEGIYSRTV
jgi:oxygen-independent coproporphyrinogen-3 oxidase